MTKSKTGLSIKISAFLISLLMLLSMLPIQAFATGENTDAVLNIPVHKSVTGDTSSEKETFVFVLSAKDNAPMPAGSVNGSRTVTIDGSGTAYFGDIAFTDIGEYRYSVSEVKGNNTSYQYDDSAYEIFVQVTWKNTVGGEKQAVMFVSKSGGTAKTEKILFMNMYTKPTDPYTPRTGDTGVIGLWLTLMFVSIVGIVLIVKPKRLMKDH